MYEVSQEKDLFSVPKSLVVDKLIDSNKFYQEKLVKLEPELILTPHTLIPAALITFWEKWVAKTSGFYTNSNRVTLYISNGEL